MESLIGNPAGFNLIEVAEDSWMFQPGDSEPTFGTFREIMLIAILHYNFKMSELEKGVHAMLEKNHNAAHFGVWQSFIYSFNYKFSVERKAS